MTEIKVDRTNEENGKRVLTTNLDDFIEIAKALSTDLRIAMFKQLLERPMNVIEISELFSLPHSTAAVNIKKLEDAKLIRTEMIPGSRGTQKLCTAPFSRIIIDTSGLGKLTTEEEKSVVIPMPVGHFFDFSVSGTCGILSADSIIGELDDPASFLDTARIDAQLIWFRYGYVEYRFPNRTPKGTKPNKLELTMEICSEAPFYNLDWPSDITLWINGIEVGTWVSPADFGGERGVLTPEWWGVENTQFGMLKTWKVTGEGSFIDGRTISEVTLEELNLDKSSSITVRIGVKPDAQNDGGVNLFGKKFGNYETDLMMRLSFN